MKRLIYSFVIVSLTITTLAAQTPVEVLYYSRITQSFDRQPPIGVDFQIKGSITPDIVAVKLESFGFDMRGPNRAHEIELINVLTNTDHSRPLCEVLAEVRNDDTRPRGYGSWERPTDATGATLSQFSMNHQRLYYGRRYVFLMSYYTRISDAQKKEITKKIVKNLYTVILDKVDANESFSENDWNLELAKLEPELRSNQAQTMCGPEILHRRTLKPIDISDYFLTLVAQSYQAKLNNTTLQEGQQELAQFLPDLQRDADVFKTAFEELTTNIATPDWTKVAANLTALEGKLDPTKFTGVAELVSFNTHVLAKKSTVAGTTADQNDIKNNRTAEITAAAAEIAKRFKEVIDKIDAEAWDDAERALFKFGIFKAGSDALNTGDKLLIAIGKIKTGSQVMSSTTSIDEVVEKTLAALPFSEGDELMTATSSQPYFDSMEKEQQFLISLDGGLAYVSKFRELIPVVGVNFKLNRIDFNDPWNDKVEWSIVLGLGMTKPDDLDPDYKGIFDRTGDRSLMIGLGMRPPKAGKLIRLQVGAAFYRQADRNPVVRDFTTQVSPYFGLSLNWNTLDFIAGLFRNRSNFNLGN
jgi:hypothetical protein